MTRVRVHEGETLYQVRYGDDDLEELTETEFIKGIVAPAMPAGIGQSLIKEFKDIKPLCILKMVKGKHPAIAEQFTQVLSAYKLHCGQGCMPAGQNLL